tara:strand:- start:681 stop:1958 length:1278 start_codon:yes stop_codon:yes gene_type:complete
MKLLIFILGLGFLIQTEVSAIPNSFLSNGTTPVPIIPAFPRFNADLTEEFLSEDNWTQGDFSGPWEDEPSLPDLTIQRMAANPVVLGEVPMRVVAYSDEAGVAEVAIHYLDAGLYFGYRYGGESTREDRDAGRAKRTEFSHHYKELSKSLTEKLEDGCGRGTEGQIGYSPSLRTEFVDYKWENFVLRFIQREDHSVSLHIYRSDRVMHSLVDPEWAELSRRDREDLLEERVNQDDSGALQVEGLPMFTQGVTPFCSVHSLAMVSHYLGLRARPEALVAAADFKNTGSAGGSDLIEVHRAVARELGMRVSMAPKFDADKVERSIEDGLPVIVWRRVSIEREQQRQLGAQSLEGDESAEITPLSEKVLSTLPNRELSGPSHASIVTGIHSEVGEVIYTEPWGDETRGRRMSSEEMEATVYAVFYFKL